MQMDRDDTYEIEVQRLGESTQKLQTPIIDFPKRESRRTEQKK